VKRESVCGCEGITNWTRTKRKRKEKRQKGLSLEETRAVNGFKKRRFGSTEAEAAKQQRPK
jgi:hypothetical protein